MSATPRTDGFGKIRYGGCDYVDIKDCRELEHELIEAQQDIRQLKARLKIGLRSYELLCNKIRDKWLKYGTDMEGAGEPEFGQAEWAAGAFLQLMREEGIPQK